MQSVSAFRVRDTTTDVEEQALGEEMFRRLRASRTSGDQVPVAHMVYTGSLPLHMERAARSWVKQGWRVGIVPIAGGLQHVLWVKQPDDRESAALLDQRRDHRNPEAPLLPASDTAPEADEKAALHDTRRA